MDREQRRRTRIPIQLEVNVRVKDEVVVVTSRNISLKGLLCSPDPRLRQGQHCQVFLRLRPTIHMNIEGMVVRTTARETAIDFIAMDEDSFTHLKKIVEFNTEDPDRIAEELLRPAFAGVSEQDQ